MPPGTASKSRRTGGALQIVDCGAIVPLLLDRSAFSQALLQVNRAPVGAHACLRKSGDLARHVLGCFAGTCRWHQHLAQADAQALYRVLAEIGGADLVGPARELDPGTFYGAGPGE